MSLGGLPPGRSGAGCGPRALSQPDRAHPNPSPEGRGLYQCSIQAIAEQVHSRSRAFQTRTCQPKRCWARSPLRANTSTRCSTARMTGCKRLPWLRSSPANASICRWPVQTRSSLRLQLAMLTSRSLCSKGFCLVTKAADAMTTPDKKLEEWPAWPRANPDDGEPACACERQDMEIRQVMVRRIPEDIDRLTREIFGQNN